ncbi:hypothetical protein RCCGE510_16664 [Rhizobium sp. CCGE 510]|nr:hypothetical protein RCCGE510_16664 [Rhizobium sp. CCGE 510]
MNLATITGAGRTATVAQPRITFRGRSGLSPKLIDSHRSYTDAKASAEADRSAFVDYNRLFITKD